MTHAVKMSLSTNARHRYLKVVQEEGWMDGWTTVNSGKGKQKAVN